MSNKLPSSPLDHHNARISMSLPIFMSCVLLLLPLPVTSFNIDVDTTLVHRGAPGTYFGFSVAQHKDGRTSWLLVGAPLASTDQPNVERGGVVFKCSPDSTNSCQSIPFDVNGSSTIQLKGKQEQVDEKSNQWFGAVVKSTGKSGMILACAPRYVHYTSNRKRREPVGTCYLSRGSFTGFLEYSPCRTPTGWGYHKQGSCMAGSSAAISPDGKRAFIGAPGSWFWQGQVFSQNLIASPTLPDGKETPDSTPISPEKYDDSYLGYSMSIGKFSSSNESDVAVGMPRGKGLLGEVVIYSGHLANLVNITGEQMGSYFGHSLATADINGDGLEDIVIGAPLYYKVHSKDSSFENGRIYVAYQTRDHKFEIRTRVDGVRSKGRFGSAVTSLGDLNKDGYQDIAVGAPYDGDHGAGAVYIFNGGPKGLDTEPSQIIYAEQLMKLPTEEGLNTFGFSLSSGLDLDNNEYPDLLVGAYNSDRAFHLKGRPVVNVTAELEVQPDYINLEDKNCTLSNNETVSCVTVTYCLKYSGIGVSNDLNLLFTIRLDTGTNRPPRMFLLYSENNTEDTQVIPLKREMKLCKSFYAYLTNKLRDKLAPINVEVEYGIYDPYGHNPNSRVVKPILNKANPVKLNRQVFIEKNCGKDNRCIPDLRLTIKPNMDEYLIGSKKRLDLDVTVRNHGEDAYESMFYLSMPMAINYVNINKTKLDFSITCTGAQPEKTGMNVLACDIGNPLPANKRINFGLSFQPSNIVSAGADFTFISNVTSSNPEEMKHLEDNGAVIGIPIRVEVNMTVTGVSTPEHVIFNGSDPIIAAKSSVKDIGPQVIHTYVVQNHGPSTIREARVIVLWPSLTEYDQYLLYLLDQPTISGKGSCRTITKDDLNPLGLPLEKDHRQTGYSFLGGHIMTSDSNQVNYHYPTMSWNDTTRMKRYLRTPMTVDADDDPLNSHTSCGPRKCTTIYCSVNNLAKTESVVFSFRSRVWSSTVMDIGSVEFYVSSRMVAQVVSLPFDVNPSYLKPPEASIFTHVHVVGVDKPEPIPLWIILLAVIGGLLLLSLLILMFYKCGFFKRKRPPMIEGASEPLNGSHPGYHYAKGDTSL